MLSAALQSRIDSMPLAQILPYRDIATEIAARLCASREGCDPLEPWIEEVIVPSRGMAEAIAAAMVERMPNGVGGLRIRFLDELAKSIVHAAGLTPRVATAAERRLAMRAAIRAVDHPMMESRGIAAMLERSYRDVRDGGLTIGELRLRSRRADAITRAWTEYERLIAQLNAIDNADLLAQATRLASASLKPQLLAGFYDLTGAQLQLVQALLAVDRIAGVWIPTDLPFAQSFIQVFGTPATGGLKPAAPQVAIRFDTRFDELRGVCAQIGELLANGTPAHEIGIVARSLEPYDVRLLTRFAAEAGFRTTLDDEIPLHAHRIGRAAVTLLRLRDRGFPRADVLELVRDGLYTNASIDVNAADAATRRARIAGGTSSELRTMRKRTPIVDEYIALVAELEELTSSLDLARLGSLFRVETELDLAAAAKLDEIAALFQRASAWNRQLDLSSVLDAIEQESLSRRLPAADCPLIWAGELLRFRGRSFTHLFVIRMQDDVFPQRRTEDPLLPDSERRYLGLREIGDGREEERLLFSLLADATSERMVYSFAAGDGFGKVLRPSRYVRGFASCELRVAATNLPELATRNSQRQLQLLAKSGTHSAFDGHVGAIAPDRLTSLSPTQLEDFGECPQKFLMKHILGASDIDDPEREVQIHHRDKGKIDHLILERFYRNTTAEEIARAAAALPKLPEALVARLQSIVDAQFDELERDVPPFNRTIRGIERRATKRILTEFVASDIADLDAQQLVPRWFEYRFGTKHKNVVPDHPDPYIVHAGGVPVRVEGTIDRIDAGVARFRIVDYKSGKALRHANLSEKIDRGVRLQLALYAMAVSSFFDADPSTVSGTIKPLVIGEKAKFAFELHEKRDALLETLEIFLRAIQSGTFPAFPNENDAEFNSCKYCPVNHSCRTKHDAEERYVLQQLRDPRTLLGGVPR